MSIEIAVVVFCAAVTVAAPVYVVVHFVRGPGRS